MSRIFIIFVSLNDGCGSLIIFPGYSYPGDIVVKSFEFLLLIKNRKIQNIQQNKTSKSSTIGLLKWRPAGQIRPPSSFCSALEEVYLCGKNLIIYQEKRQNS